MSLKNLHVALAAVGLLAMAALGLALDGIADAQRDIAAVEAQRGVALQAAARARQSSDDLTRMARGYAVTSDARYGELYAHIARVRDGKAPRPPGDASAHWDLLLAGSAAAKGEGERLALADDIARARLPAREQAHFDNARAAQEALERLEAQALAAMKGEASGAPPGKPDPVFALQTLYGDAYLEAKARALQALAALQADIETRSRDELARAHQQLARKQQLAWLSLIGFGATALALLALMAWRGLRPLLALRHHAHALVNQDYVARSQVAALPEISRLADALNEASSRLEAGARELAEQELYVEALLRASPLGLLLIDAKHRVRWTSRRLRDLLGDSKQDLKQMPLDELFADPAELTAFREALAGQGRVQELAARLRRRDGGELRARLDASHVERAAERFAAVWIQAFGPQPRQAP